MFYPKDGKLEGTVADMDKGNYDFGVKLYEKDSQSSSSGNFENINVEPKDTELKPKHDGAVHLIDGTKMELVRQDNKLKIYLRDENDKPVDTSKASLSDTVVGIRQDEKEVVEMAPAGDHFEGDISGDVDEDALKLISGVLKIDAKEYKDLRIPTIPSIGDNKEGPSLTKTTVTKSKEGKQKGAIGTIALDPGEGQTGGGGGGGSSKNKKKGKGPVTKAKKGN